MLNWTALQLSLILSGQKCIVFYLSFMAAIALCLCSFSPKGLVVMAKEEIGTHGTFWLFQYHSHKTRNLENFHMVMCTSCHLRGKMAKFSVWSCFFMYEKKHPAISYINVTLTKNKFRNQKFWTLKIHTFHIMDLIMEILFPQNHVFWTFRL